jgi:hypothetical protein
MEAPTKIPRAYRAIAITRQPTVMARRISTPQRRDWSVHRHRLIFYDFFLRRKGSTRDAELRLPRSLRIRGCDSRRRASSIFHARAIPVAATPRARLL